MPTENVIDLEAVVKAWAWQEYEAIANKKQRKLLKKEGMKRQTYINLTVDWSEVFFEDKQREFPVKLEDLVNSESADGGVKRSEASSTVAAGQTRKARPTISVLFSTKFKNLTDREQEYTMRTERTTKSALITEVESSYTKGFEMGVSLKTPSELLEASAGFHREYSLTHLSGESFEEELQWGVDSVIKVKKNHVAIAQLVVFEQKGHGHFVVETEISGRVYVTFTNIRDNNSFIMATSEDICQVVDEHVSAERKNGRNMDFVRVDLKAGKVYIKTTGCCQFQYGIRQEVQVDQKPLGANTDSDYSADGGKEIAIDDDEI